MTCQQCTVKKKNETVNETVIETVIETVNYII